MYLKTHKWLQFSYALVPKVDIMPYLLAEMGC